MPKAAAGAPFLRTLPPGLAEGSPGEKRQKGFRVVPPMHNSEGSGISPVTVTEYMMGTTLNSLRADSVLGPEAMQAQATEANCLAPDP